MNLFVKTMALCLKLRQRIGQQKEHIFTCRNFCASHTSTYEKLEHIILEKDNNITLIGINREAKRNAIDVATAQELSKAFQIFEDDDSSPVAVLYGVGGSFSSGHDFLELEGEVERNKLNFIMKQEDASTCSHIRKPVVCGINGFCVASGLELALMCDLRIMENSAVLGFFNRRFGVPINYGAVVRLAGIVGHSRALDLITTGRTIKGQEALNIGLVNRLVAGGTALGQSVHLAFSLAKYPQASLRHDRSAVYANVHERITFRQAMQNEVLSTPKDLLLEMRKAIAYSKRDKNADIISYWNRDKSISEWEKDEISLEKEYLKTKTELLHVVT